ncbi:MAG: RNA methyltransferase [Saprospiraceae bacterium]|jgi:TrmH family RNA methyltransferase|nr:RNA methyltransferase [Saprospiraceae bacterium]
MLSINQTKLITSLAIKKYRQQHQKFIVEGEKMVGELLGQSRIGVSAIFGLESWAASNAGLLRPFSDKFNAVTELELGKISMLTTPNSVLAIADMPHEPLDAALPASDVCFYLDGIQDPGNMGTMLRIADWFGLPAVFCSLDCADLYSPKVVQASMGAVFRVKSWALPLAELLEQQPGLAVAGAVLGGENVFEAVLPAHGLLVMGNEGRGISAEVERLLTHRITIPRHPAGSAESLNAAVAAGILVAMYSASRSAAALRR